MLEYRSVRERYIVTDRVRTFSGQGNAISRVRPSVRLFALLRMNRLTFDLAFLLVYGSPGFENQGHDGSM